MLGTQAEDLVEVRSGLKLGEFVCLSQERRKEKKAGENQPASEKTAKK